jgi:hypothetical protein
VLARRPPRLAASSRDRARRATLTRLGIRG